MQGIRYNIPVYESTEDLIENTKPNLISFSLSTSSSNHTFPSVPTEFDRELEMSFSKNLEEPMVEIVKSFEIPKRSNNVNKLSALVIPTYSLGSYNNSKKVNQTRQVGNTISNKQTKGEIVSNIVKNKTSSFELNNIKYRRNCVSLFDLTNVNVSNNFISRVTSQPELNRSDALTNPCVSVTSEIISPVYEDIQSQLKNYNKRLKGTINRSPNLVSEEKEESALCDKNYTMFDLQLEIQRLQSLLEERDVLLEEVRANHNTLLLKYGEARNKLDQLRFVSSRKMHSVKSVQTEPFSKINESMVYSKDADLAENLHEMMNWTPTNAPLQLITENEVCNKSKCIKCKGEGAFGFEARTNVDCKCNPELMEKIYNISLPDISFLKVSTCPPLSQTQPVPSGYGSLGSNGNISNQQDDDKSFEESALLSLLQKDISKDVNGMQLLMDQTLSSVCDEVNEMLTDKGRESCVLCLDKCDCWNPPNITEFNNLEKYSSESPVKSEIQGAVCVPPLNLEWLKNGLPLPKCNILHQPNSDLCSVSHVMCDTSCSRSYNNNNDSFEKYCDTGIGNDKKNSYLETPTSYKSIKINCVPDKNLSSHKCCSPWSCVTDDQYKERNSVLQKVTSSGTEDKCSRISWRKNFFHCSCCSKKGICSGYARTSYNISRYKECTSGRCFKHLNSEALPDANFIHRVSVHAEDLRKKSEVIHNFLTKHFASESHD